MRCLDCGNKAKKDCLYYRCRSCCRGHGFWCQTHVKSTWVPVSTRQVLRTAATASSAPPPHHRQEEQQQLHHPSSSGLREGNFPAEVNGVATFVGVRVASSSGENAAMDQYAYETTVNIGGHVFRGILYDQGPIDPTIVSLERNMDGGDQ